jgi:hypothetical protein
MAQRLGYQHIADRKSLIHSRGLFRANRPGSARLGFLHASQQAIGRRKPSGSSQPRPSPYAKQRRSQRILLSIPVIVSGEKAKGTPFSERTRTLVVNAHGALIELREPVLIGQPLRIKNAATNEEMNCKVADINPEHTNLPEIGVEFAEECAHFWRVSFPPADWTPRSPGARRSTPLPAAPALVKK